MVLWGVGFQYVTENAELCELRILIAIAIPGVKLNTVLCDL